MPIRTLRALIRASGHAGIAGQSFRNHVSGAGSGTRMRQYILHGWSNWVTGTPSGTMQSGTTFPATFNFDHEGAFGGILRPAAEMSAYTTIDTIKSEGSPVNADIVGGTLTSQPPGGGSCSITIRVTGGHVPVNTLMYGGYGFVNEPPGWVPPDMNEYDIEVWVNPSPTQASILGQTDTGYLWIVYPSDPGNFNDGLEYGPIGPLVVQRTLGSQATFEVEWYRDDSMTELLQLGGYSLRFPSIPGVTPGQGHIYCRWRNAPSMGWTGVYCYWDEPRWN